MVMTNCSIEWHLRYLAADERASSTGIGHAASSALAIIRDLRETAMTRVDVECLQMLLDAIHDAQPLLFQAFDFDAPDCALCEALAAHFSQPA